MKRLQILTAFFLGFMVTNDAHAESATSLLDAVENGRLQLRLLSADGFEQPTVLDNGDWLIPAITAERYVRIFGHYLAMGRLFRLAQRRTDTLWRIVLRASLAVARADCGVSLADAAIDASTAWRWWEVTLLVTGAALAALGLGLILGTVLGGNGVVIAH